MEHFDFIASSDVVGAAVLLGLALTAVALQVGFGPEGRRRLAGCLFIVVAQLLAITPLLGLLRGSHPALAEDFLKPLNILVVLLLCGLQAFGLLGRTAAAAWSGLQTAKARWMKEPWLAGLAVLCGTSLAVLHFLGKDTIGPFLTIPMFLTAYALRPADRRRGVVVGVGIFATGVISLILPPRTPAVTAVGTLLCFADFCLIYGLAFVEPGAAEPETTQ